MNASQKIPKRELSAYTVIFKFGYQDVIIAIITKVTNKALKMCGFYMYLLTTN